MIRRQKDVCLLQRHVFKSQHSIPISPYCMRYGSSRSREPFILPRVVIDLDANDSPFVRQATEEDYAVRPKPPRWQRYESTVTSGGQEKLLQQNRPTPYALQTRTVTAPDLLAYALLGNPNALPKDDNLALRMQFKHKKIHPLDNADTKIKRLTYDFTTDASKVLECAGFTPERLPLIVEEIRKCTSFKRLKRILTMLASTTEGCKFLATNGAAVVNGIKCCRKYQDRGSSKVAAGMVMRVLNNLALSLQSKGVELGPDLCSAAIYYASKSFNLPSIRRYLDVLTENSYQPQNRAIRAINELVISHRRGSSFHSSRKRHLSQKRQNREVLTLLTGWDSKGVPSHSEERQTCFASHIVAQTNGPVRRISSMEYVVALGYIGASDALWYEWENDPDHKFLREASSYDHMLLPLQLSRHPGKADIGGKVEIFALAFLMAEDSKRALEVLKMFFKYDGHYNTLIQPAADDTSWANELNHNVEDAKTAGDVSPPLNENSNEYGVVIQPFPPIIQADETGEDPKIAGNLDMPSFENKYSLQYNAPGESSPLSIQLGYQTRAKIIWYYKSKNMTATERLHERLDAKFVPEKPDTILRAMDELLVPAWIQLKESTDAPAEDSFAHYHLDWDDQDGVEGVAVMKALGGEIVHFKPSSRGLSSPDTEKSPDSSRSSVDEQ